MYPEEIINFAQQLKDMNKPLAKRTRRGETYYFTNLKNLFIKHKIDLESIFNDEFSLMEMVHCISQNHGPAICKTKNCKNIVHESWKKRKYCSITCRSNDADFCDNLSLIKQDLYDDPVWKKSVEDKKEATNIENLGVPHPMQNPTSHKKQLKSAFKLDENGLQGTERISHPWLKQFYEEVIIGTDYLEETGSEIKWFDELDNKFHVSYPDFWIPELNAFVESKGLYTREAHNRKIMKCAERLYEMNYAYVIVTVDEYRKDKYKFNFEIYNEKFLHDEYEPMYLPPKDQSCGIENIDPGYSDIEKSIIKKTPKYV